VAAAGLCGQATAAELPHIPGNYGHYPPDFPTRLYLAGPQGVQTLASPGWAGRWSPTGDWIAYENGSWSTSVGERLNLVRPDGTGRRTIGTGIGAVGWSPDGARLLVRGSAGYRILSIGGDGRVVARRALPPGIPRGSTQVSAAWSGSEALVISGQRRGTVTMVRASLSGGRVRVLLRRAGITLQIDSATPKGVVLVQKDSEAAVSTGPGRLRRLPGANNRAALLPDGRVLVTRGKVYAPVPGRLLAITARTGATRLLRRDAEALSAIAPTIGGDRIALTRIVPDNFGELRAVVSIVDGQGALITELAVLADPSGTPSLDFRSPLDISPDGSQVLVETPFNHGDG
jgi:hypothetical protein